MRTEKFEGKDHAVIPVVMLVEGVVAGSNGPLFYPADELKASVQAWNGKPVVVYHPMQYGTPISACTPQVLNARKIGTVFNARFSGKKLHAEAWIDLAAAERVDNRVVRAIRTYQNLEISTGVFTTNLNVNGVLMACNHKPDHLAILPDQQGACSLRDGCGLLVANDRMNQPLGLPKIDWSNN